MDPITSKNISSFNGTFLNSKPNGHGFAKLNNGEFYDGSWVKGKAHGTGRYSNGDNEEYVGEFRNGLFHGYGEYSNLFFDKEPADSEWQECCIYSGNFKNGNFHGQGRVIWYYHKDHAHDFKKDIHEYCCYYEGSFKDDEATGKGMELRKDDTIYTGKFLKQQRHGKGELKNVNNRIIYSGKWKNDSMHGQGKLMINGGVVYEGKLLSNKINGRGKMTFPDGKILEGFWKGKGDTNISLNIEDLVESVSLNVYVKLENKSPVINYNNNLLVKFPNNLYENLPISSPPSPPSRPCTPIPQILSRPASLSIELINRVLIPPFESVFSPQPISAISPIIEDNWESSINLESPFQEISVDKVSTNF